MPKADFQERIQRIAAKSPQQQATVYGGPQTAPIRAQKPNLGIVFVGSFMMSFGLFITRGLNEKYEAARDIGGLGFVAMSALCGFAFLLTGCIVMLRAFSKQRATRNGATLQNSERGERPVRKASSRTKVICSLIGFSFGAISCVCLFLAAIALNIETEAAKQFFVGANIIAASFLILSLLIGFAGIFLRGFALGRVPAYYWLGAMLTYATFFLLNIYPQSFDQIRQGLQ